MGHHRGHPVRLLRLQQAERRTVHPPLAAVGSRCTVEYGGTVWIGFIQAAGPFCVAAVRCSYTLFFVLYPTGAGSEFILAYNALPYVTNPYLYYGLAFLLSLYFPRTSSNGVVPGWTPDMPTYLGRCCA